MSGSAVSGLQLGETFASMHMVPGREILNGGKFGIEGSIVTLVVFSLACFYLIIKLNQKANRQGAE
jgi:uncharacterized protein